MRKNIPKRPLAAALASGLLIWSGAATAQNYPWCANFADGAGVNCGFPTLQQCMATATGSGGYCTSNTLYESGPTRPSRRAGAGRHHARKR